MFATLREAHDALERWFGVGTSIRSCWIGWTVRESSGGYSFMVAMGSDRQSNCVRPKSHLTLVP